MVVITRVRKKRKKKKKMVDDLEEGKIAILKICSNLLYISLLKEAIHFG